MGLIGSRLFLLFFSMRPFIDLRRAGGLFLGRVYSVRRLGLLRFCSLWFLPLWRIRGFFLFT